MTWSGRAAFLLCLLLGACTRSVPSTGPQPDTLENVADATSLGDLPPDNVLVSDEASLAGTWYAWAAEGDPHRGDIVLTINGQTMVATSGCATLAWTFRVLASRLHVAKAPVASCARGLTPREDQFVEALGAANVAYHRGGRGLVFEGPRGRIVLLDRGSERR